MTMDKATVTVVLGDEYDIKLRDVLRTVLFELGGHIRSHDWGVGGSQELDRTEVEVGGEMLVVETETYVGLTIAGSPGLTARLKALVDARMAELSHPGNSGDSR